MKFYSHLPNRTSIPFFDVRICAGFPSPAEDYMDKSLSLDELLIRTPEATFFAEIEGDSMIDSMITEGDIAVIDKSLLAKNNSLVLAYVEGIGFTIKRYVKKAGKIYLSPSNKKYQAIELTEFVNARIWGVVIATVRKY